MEEQQQGAQQPAIDYAALTNSLMSALSARQERAENGVVRSFAEQYGMSETEVKTILSEARKNKDNTPTAEQQKQIDAALAKANERLLSAEVTAVGSTMGLVDPAVALSLLDRSKIKIEDDGKVSGVKEALDALKTEKAYLFPAAVEKPKRTGMRQAQGEPSKGQHDDINSALRAVLGKGK